MTSKQLSLKLRDYKSQAIFVENGYSIGWPEIKQDFKLLDQLLSSTSSNEVIFISNDRSSKYLIKILYCLTHNRSMFLVEEGIDLQKTLETAQNYGGGIVLFNDSVTSTANQGRRFHPSRPSICLLSSGTTSEQKAIVQNHETIIKSAQLFGSLIPFPGELSHLHWMPMHYMAGIFNLLLVPLLRGETIYVDVRSPLVSSIDFCNLGAAEHPSCIIVTPELIRLLLSRLPASQSVIESFSNAKLLYSTSSLLSEDLIMRFEQYFEKSLSNCYGVTELGGSLTFGQSRGAIGTTGNLRADIEVIPASEDASQYHELKLASSTIFAGYMYPGARFVEYSKPNFVTGDIGTAINRELLVYGRLNDLIQIGDNRVQAEPLSQYLCDTFNEIGGCLILQDPTTKNIWVLIELKLNQHNPRSLSKKIKQVLHQKLQCDENLRVKFTAIKRTASGKIVKDLLRYVES